MTSLPPARRFDWSNLRLRVLSAAVLVPVAVLALWFDGVALLVVMALAAALLSREWAKMSAPRSPLRAMSAMAVSVIIALSAAYMRRFQLAWILVVLGAGACALLSQVRRNADRPADEAFGVIYIGAPTVALFWLRSGVSGQGWVMALLASAWAADIAAYAAGNFFGGAKLWPRISPNKTWSGFMAGLAAAIAAGEVFAATGLGRGAATLMSAWWIGLVVGGATMAGDLWESMLKRRFGVKDSGDLIPGHGGLLDRVDGLMFATLALAVVRVALSFGAVR